MKESTASIGTTIAFGVMFDPKNGAQAQSMDFNQLQASVEKLFDLLDEREVDYVVVGGIAMLAYTEGRNTQDINLLLSREAVATIEELVVDDENNEFLRAHFGQLQVDVLLTNKTLFSYVASKHVTEQDFAGRMIHCATPEGLAILKLFALPSMYRQGNFAKVRIYEGDLEALLDTCALEPASLVDGLRNELAESDVKEIESILADIEQRIAAKRKRFGG